MKKTSPKVDREIRDIFFSLSLSFKFAITSSATATIRNNIRMSIDKLKIFVAIAKRGIRNRGKIIYSSTSFIFWKYSGVTFVF